MDYRYAYKARNEIYYSLFLKKKTDRNKDDKMRNVQFCCLLTSVSIFIFFFIIYFFCICIFTLFMTFFSKDVYYYFYLVPGEKKNCNNNVRIYMRITRSEKYVYGARYIRCNTVISDGNCGFSLYISHVPHSTRSLFSALF